MISGSGAVKQIGYRILVGIGGVLLLSIILLGLLPAPALIRFIPWLIGFNCALTGYTIVEKTRGRIQNRGWAAASVGLVTALAAHGVLAVIFVALVGEPLMTWGDLLLNLLVGCASSGLGAFLAVKYFNLT